MKSVSSVVLFSTKNPDATMKSGFDIDTIYLISLLRLFNIDFSHQVAQNDFSPSGKLPCIMLNNDSVYGLQDCLSILEKEFNIPRPVRCALSLSAILEGPIQRAIDYELYYDENVYHKIAKVHLAGFHPFPLNFILPLIDRRQAIERLLAFHPVLNAQSIYPPAFSGLAAFSDYLGDQPYLFGESISSLDARLFSYLHIFSALLSKMDTRLFKIFSSNDSLQNFHLRFLKISTTS